MDKRVAGVYPNLEQAFQAIDQLRNQGYTHDRIILVANEANRKLLSTDVYADVASQDIEKESTKNKASLWESIKEAFTTDEAYESARYNDPNYLTEDDPVCQYKEAVDKGSIVILVREGTLTDIHPEPDLTEKITKPRTEATSQTESESKHKTPLATTQPNTIGPKGTRKYEDEHALSAKEASLKDPDLTREELEDYERRQ